MTEERRTIFLSALILLHPQVPTGKGGNSVVIP